MGILSTFSLLAILLLSVTAWAQPTSSCAEFKDITQDCILDSKKPYSDKPIALSKLRKDSILFYKTPSGDFGKMRILSQINKPSNQKAPECTLFIDALTYSQDQVFVPNSSLSVSPEKNYWLSDKIFLDRDGLAALVLEKNDKGCVVAPSKGSEYVIHKFGPEEQELTFKESNYALFIAPLVLVFVSIFLIVRVFMEDQDKYKTQEALEDAENASKSLKQPLFLKITKPFYKRYFLPIVQSSKARGSIKTKYRQKLANAGLSKEMSPEEFVALKFFMIIGGPFAFLAVRYIMEETWSLGLTPVMGIVGYFYPDIWLSGTIKKRGDEVIRAMPFIIDMLALSVEAGLDFMAAIQRVIEKAPVSPLVEEFETLIKETRIGSSRSEGLRQLAWRVNIIEINSFCATLIAADSVGASIGPLLKQLSSELRVKRSSRAEQLGATAATKILIPMIFFILPAVLVAIFAPMLLQMLSGNS
jgi:tight adherence protein C